MTLDADPYRTLGLASGASADEVKRAYRRLAKVHHPDAAGEKALPRFLAIQAAYEQLIGGLDSTSRGRRGPSTPRRPWEADPDRSDATRRAYGGRAKNASAGASPAGSSASAGAGGPGSAGRSWSGRTGDAAGGSTRTGRRRRGEPRGTTGARPADMSSGATDGPPSKATLGSTSYDGADAGPFEPDWGGASWYGTTSGTYWTLNPKEYADPRKHGPEYQARARRAARVSGSAISGSTAAAGPSARAATDPAPGAAPGPTHTTGSWWESTAGAAGPAAPDRPAAPSRAQSPPPPIDTGAAHADPPPPDLGRAAADIGRVLTDEGVGGPAGRVARAVIGWLPVALGIGWLTGELTGCGRFAATCDGRSDPFVLLLQIALLALLLLLPALASIAAGAAVAVIVAAVITTLILSATGGAADGGSRQSTLGAVLLIAWLIGVAVSTLRRVRLPRSPTRPVS